MNSIYTLWASMKVEEPMPWMIAAEDDVAWAANPDRCEAVFRAARKLADDNDWDVREIVLQVEDEDVRDAFHSTLIAAAVSPSKL